MHGPQAIVRGPATHTVPCYENHALSDGYHLFFLETECHKSGLRREFILIMIENVFAEIGVIYRTVLHSAYSLHCKQLASSH